MTISNHSRFRQPRLIDCTRDTPPLGPVAALADAAVALDRACDGRTLSPLELRLLKDTHSRLGFLLIEQGGF